MAKEVQCYYCKKKFPKEELIQVTKTIRCCSACNETKRKEAQEYKDLIKFICDGFMLDKPTGQHIKSIKEFKELGYTYTEMKLTLYYIFCVLKKKPVGTSIGLIPYYYQEAKSHFAAIQRAKESIIKVSQEERIIEINKNSKPKKSRTRLINIEEIFAGGQ